MSASEVDCFPPRQDTSSPSGLSKLVVILPFLEMSESSDTFPTRIETWSELSGLVDHFSQYSAHDWLFRGVTNETHGLVAKIGRPKTRGIKKQIRSPYQLEDEIALYSMFRSQAMAYTERQPSTSLEWLALAQHFGVPTRLLDWTESFFVAAWFAVQKGGVKDSKADSAIWVTRGIETIDAGETLDPLSIKNARAYRPAYVSQRISAQASVLVVCPSPTNEVILPFTWKITIAKNAEFVLKKRLNACGIHHRLLFPDLQGLAEHLGWLYKHDYLAGHRPGKHKEVAPTPD
jgi:hypothetical protein